MAKPNQMMDPFVFVNYDGPKLSKSQKGAVRSQAMFSVRDKQRKGFAEGQTCFWSPTLPDGLFPKQWEDVVFRDQDASDPHSWAVNTAEEVVRRQKQKHWNVKLFPRLTVREYPQVGRDVGEGIYSAFIKRHKEFDDFVDHGFTLVGYHKPMYYRPDPNYGLCIFVGWLISSATLDAHRGYTDISYPFYEMKSVRKIGKLLQDPNKHPLAVTVVPIMIMVLFETIRAGSAASTHMEALQKLIKSHGGIRNVRPRVAQHIIVTIDLLRALSFNTSLAFLPIQKPISSLLLSSREGKFFASSPLIRCDNEQFSKLAAFLDMDDDSAAEVANMYERMLKLTTWIYERRGTPGFEDELRRKGKEELRTLDLDQHANAKLPHHTAKDVLMQSSALACRIFLRTVSTTRHLSNDDNKDDMRALHDCLKMYGLQPWAGMPYLYMWCILIGMASSSSIEKPYFTSEIARIAMSFGLYQPEIFPVFLQNFIGLRRVLEGPPTETSLEPAQESLRGASGSN